jgi:magnesium transporter
VANAGDRHVSETFSVVLVDLAVYEEGRRRPGALALEEAYEACRREGTFTWLGLFEPTEDEFDSVRREFDLHELAIEDAVKAHQRPKLEVYGDSLFLVLKTARWQAEHESIEFGEILLFLGNHFLVSVRHGETELHDVRLRLERRPELLGLGETAALHAIVDRVVDDYEPVVDALDAVINDVESQVFSADRENPAERIYRLKRAVLELDGAVVPLVEPISLLASGAFPQVPEELRTYFRDVEDHLRRIASRVREYRDLLTSVLTANLTQFSVRQNEDVRRISAWAAIIAVPTAIAGIYGMNFEHMPELDWTFGYPLVLAVIALACAALYWRFRKIGWL